MNQGLLGWSYFLTCLILSYGFSCDCLVFWIWFCLTEIRVILFCPILVLCKLESCLFFVSSCLVLVLVLSWSFSSSPFSLYRFVLVLGCLVLCWLACGMCLCFASVYLLVLWRQDKTRQDKTRHDNATQHSTRTRHTTITRQTRLDKTTRQDTTLRDRKLNIRGGSDQKQVVFRCRTSKRARLAENMDLIEVDKICTICNLYHNYN